MDHTQVERTALERAADTDMVASWPRPASEIGADNVEPGRLEREIKFAVPSLAPIEQRLRALEQAEARFLGITHERNCVLDTDHGDLKARDERLRVREIEGRPGVQVTWKGPARVENGVRRREEREFHADDQAACLAVLSNLGLRPIRPYEKVRSSWLVDEVIVCLDDLPFGYFVELELTPEIGQDDEADAVESMVALLGLTHAQHIQASYARLQQEWQDVLSKHARKAGKAAR